VGQCKVKVAAANARGSMSRDANDADCIVPHVGINPVQRVLRIA
jgi:hypothetical protein